MIHFACPCGKQFDEPDDRAGDSFQCPQCLRLVDVPLLSELGSLEADGTLKIADAEPNESALGDKVHTFQHRDDLRQDVDEYLALDDAPPADAAPQKLPPRYDPVTGELLEEIGVKGDAPVPLPQNIPLAKPALDYASSGSPTVNSDIRWWQMPWRLLAGMSLMSMLFVFGAHMLIHLFLVMPGANFLLAPLSLLIATAIVAHYGNVMEEIGPQNHDDVPVMLRRVSFGEDFLHPVLGMLYGFLFAFGPVLFALIIGLGPILRKQPWILTAIGAWGLFVFPAAAFTAVTSGAIENMLPHHVLAVIRVAFWRYLLAWMAFMVGMIAYVSAARGLAVTSFSVLTAPPGQVPWKLIIGGTALLYGSMLIAIYFTHLSVAWMGMIYRTHHARFNWVYQQHQKRPRTDTLAQLEDMRRRGDPRLKRKIDPARLQALREAESARHAQHAQVMRKL